MAETTDLQRLVVSLEARLDKYTRAMQKLQGDTNRTLASVESRFKRAEGVLAGFGKRLAAGFTAAAVGQFVKSAVKDLAELADNAKRAGVSVESLQKAIFAARQEGGNAETIVAAFSKLNLSLGQAASKGNDLGKIFKANNIAIKEMQGDPVRALLTIADLMKNAATAQDAAVIGQAAFGKGFREMLPFLMQGSEEIQKQMERAQALGAVIDEDLVKKAKEFDDAWTAVWDAFSAQSKGAVVRAGERLESLFRMLRGDKLAPGQSAFFTPLEDMRFAGDVRQHHPTPRRPATVVPDEVAEKKPTESTKEAAKEAERQAEAITKVIEGLKFERDQLTRTDRERAIYNELAKAGVALDTAAGKAIADLAGKFHDEEQALKDLTGSMDEARDATKSFFSDLISGLREGKSLTEALGAAFERLADKLLDRLLDQAVAGLLGPSGTSQGGFLGSLLGLTPQQTATLPGVSRNPFDIMRGVVPPAQRIAPGPTWSVDPVTGRPLPPISNIHGVQRGGKADFGSLGPGAPGAVTGRPLAAYPYSDLINEASVKYGIDPDLLAGLIKKESSFNRFADNPTSTAAGLTQLLKGTQKDLGVTDPFDPRQSIMGGADYLRQQMDRFGDTRTALAAYYQGPGAVARGGVSAEGGAYADSIIRQSELYAQQMQQSGATLSTSLSNVAATASSAGGSFAGQFPAALQAILGSLGGIGGGGFASIGSLFEHMPAMAKGGPLAAGKAAIVGEEGPEIFIPKIAGNIIPNGAGMGGGLMVDVRPSKYFDVRVERISRAGDARTLDSARRAYPETASRFQKLGTTTR